MDADPCILCLTRLQEGMSRNTRSYNLQGMVNFLSRINKQIHRKV